ncbi:glycine cleavage system protein R [Novosphingobium sp. TH158]|uniref:glycine cleavage system protein R n=1 Tax=Novosphingobium sp. TH158 TaxID=2067455 RepID=UPI000C7BE7E5|nr:ACT domain-containing protein [Novosphingobium sp. TH158]PLK25904.1 amino acid-binding protein [Novosphingobium sp. TH158]
MKARIILTVLGSDRPGLTQELADAVLAAGGNWLESHLARLGGKYVGSILVELDAANLPQLSEEVLGVDASGLQVAIVPAGAAPAGDAKPILVELVGQDRPGIVREVTTVLSAIGANIESFASETEPSAHSGEELFKAKIELTLPSGSSPTQLQDALEAISGEIMVDFSFG